MDGTGLRASIVQFAALRDQVRAMEARAGELTAKQMGVLAEKKRDLRRLQKKQAAGEF